VSGLPSPIAVTSFIAHARNVASEAREKFAASALALQGDPRAMVLHTCHRVELYVADPDDGSASGEPPCDPPIPKLPAGGRVLHGDAAARHLFTVAAGLDSVVVGEDQVLHQLRECLAGRQLAALEESDEQCAEGRRPRLGAERPGELAPILDRMFQLALLKLVEVVGEAARRVSPGGQTRYPDIPWRDAITTRNRISHEYDRIDYDIVWDTITDDFPPLVVALERALAGQSP